MRSRVRVRAREGGDVRAEPVVQAEQADSVKRPADNALYWPSQNGERTVYINLPALQEVSDHAHSSPDAEVGGFLIGRSGSDDRGRFTIVDSAYRALEAAGSSIELEFPPSAWVELHRHLDSQGAAGRSACVGWYHTHPGLGLFLSRHDQFLHRHWFPGDEQVAIVADPATDEAAVFVASDGEISSPTSPEAIVQLLAPVRRHADILPSRSSILVTTEGASAREHAPDLSMLGGRESRWPAERSIVVLPRTRWVAILVVGVVLIAGLAALISTSGRKPREKEARVTQATTPVPTAPTTFPRASTTTRRPTPAVDPREDTLTTTSLAISTPPPTCELGAIDTRPEVLDTSSNDPTEGALLFTSAMECSLDIRVHVAFQRPNRRPVDTNMAVRGDVTPTGLSQPFPFPWKWCQGPTRLRVTFGEMPLFEGDVPVPESCRSDG
jgi:proteasome lid subunit RPN8/RPN11